MKHVSRLIAIALTATALSFGADTVTGTVVDMMCQSKDLAEHTKKCAIACAKSGYALVTTDGTVIKLDDEGNKKVLAALQATDKEKDLKARVTGTRDGNNMKVETIEIL